jgi:DNA-binding NarL/FixJ family response regulator
MIRDETNSKRSKGMDMEEIAKATGLRISTVRRHKRLGKLDMEDGVSVAKYVVGWRLVIEAGGKR